MISRLHGEVVEKDLDSLIIDVKGVGYQVFLSSKDIETCQLNEPATIYTYMHVRENAQELFGFMNIDTKKLFELLIGVSGVGPKMAISLLGLGDQSQLRKAIASGNTSYVSKASGVGKRLAERVVVDLKDKVGVIGGQVASDEAVDPADEAVRALMSLGYNKAQSVLALAKIDPELSTEEKVKQALKEM